MFRALLIEPQDDRMTSRVEELDDDRLPEGDTTVEVLYSSINYKDGLAVSGKAPVVRGSWPFVPGIDLVGRVVRTSSDRFAEGDVVIQNGWGLGESHWGGFAERARIRSEWLVPLPEGLTPRDAALVGTAGYTAMLAVMALEDHGVSPESGEIVVTGASGGVGSFAVHLLAILGYRVVASTGKPEADAYLRHLGAATVESRDTLSAGPGRPLESARWAGAVDNAGGPTLASVIARSSRGGCIAACGNASTHELTTTVLPFILRGVTLAGIDSNTCPSDRRERAWSRLAELVSGDALALIDAGEIGLDQIAEAAAAITSGTLCGRIVVRVSEQ
jgi:acrylyl-CoA reductase (NADPH)